MSLHPFMLLYGVLGVLSLVIVFHLRTIQRNFQDVLHELEIRLSRGVDGLDTDYSQTLTTLSRAQSTTRIPKRTIMGRLRDSPTVSIFLVASSMVITGIVAALIVVSILFSGIDVPSFIIFVSFFVYLYAQGYPHLLMYLRAVKDTELERMTTKDLKYVKTILRKVKDLQADLVFFIPTFFLLAFTYEQLRVVIISVFSDVAFYMNDLLFLPIFQINTLLGALVLIFTLVITFTLILFIIVKGWGWSRTYRRRLVR